MILRYTFAYALFAVLVFGTLALAMPKSAYAYHDDGGFGVDFCYDAFCTGYSGGDVYASPGDYYYDPYSYDPYSYDPYYGDGLGFDDGFGYYDELYGDPYYGSVYGGDLDYYYEPFNGIDDNFYNGFDNGFGYSPIYDYSEPFYGIDQSYYEPYYNTYSYPQYSSGPSYQNSYTYRGTQDEFYRDWDRVNNEWCGAYGQCNPYGSQFSYNYF